MALTDTQDSPVATPRSFLDRVYARWFEPSSTSDDARFRELTLNFALAGLFLLGCLAGLVTIALELMALSDDAGEPVHLVQIFVIVGWMVLCALFLRWSRMARLPQASAGLLGLCAVVGLGTTATWSLLLPASLMINALLVLFVCLLLDTRVAVRVLSLIGAVLTAQFVAQVSGMIPVDTNWLTEPLILSDLVVPGGSLLVLSIVGVGLRRDGRSSVREILGPGVTETPLVRLRTRDLTVRETEVTRLVAEGLPTNRIAETLFVAPSTVNSHVGSALTKTGCANRTELAVLALREGLIPLKTEDTPVSP